MKKEEVYRETNIVSYSIKCISFINLILTIIIAFVIINDVEGLDLYLKITLYILTLAAAIIGFIFTYAIGEHVQIIHDIRKKIFLLTEVKEKKSNSTDKN